MNPERQPSYVFAVLFGVPLLIVTFFTAFVLNEMWKEYLKYNSYIETECTVENARTYHTRKGNWHPDIDYTYTAGGSEQKGWGFDDGNTYSVFQFRMNSLLESYPIGSRQRCWYDPLDPKKSVLERPFPWRYSFNWLALGMMFFMIAVFSLSVISEWPGKNSKK